jgi:uncharacterized protein
MRSSRFLCVALLVALAQASSYLVSSPEAASASVVISQVYGGGGNSGAVFTHDFIELHNRGSAPVDLTGWSLQYTSATGTGNFGSSSTQLTELSGTIAAGGYLLVQEATNAAVGDPLPAPDIIDSTPINMSGTAGKVALASIATSLGCNGGSTTCTPAALAQIVDLVGYGNANFFEGAPAPGTSNTTAVVRVDGPDTDNNSLDFVLATPAPRNSAGATPALTIADVALNEGDTANTTATFVVQLSREAGLGGVSFTIAAADGTATVADLDYVAFGPVNGFIPQGENSASFAVTINADLRPEPDETFFVNVSNVAGDVTVGDAQAIGTIRNDDVERLAIHQIQGADPASPRAGQTVATTGILTARKANGFFLQSADADADASTDTSNAVFVFTSTPPLAFAVGDAVRVTGRVAEFRRAGELDTLTEITPPITVTILSRGNPLPAAVEIATFDSDAATRNAQLERYEGMLVSAPSLTAVAPTDRNGEFYAVVSGTPRPFREPGIEKTDVLPADAPPLVTRFDGNFERFIVQTGETLLPSGARAEEVLVSTGATFAPVVAPLDFAFDTYRVLLPATFSAPTTPGIAPRPLSDAPARELSMVSLNVLNFFPTSGTPAAAAAFALRVERTAGTIINELRTPDILGLIEVGDINGLRQLRDRINTLAGTDYEAYLLESDDDTERDQDVGYLVNQTRVQVERDPYQLGREATFVVCGEVDTLLDRPPFVLEARFEGTPVTVILNHLRSLIDVNNPAPFSGAPNVPCTETVGSRVREKRRLGAEFLADAIEARQDENLVVIGDMNAFEVNDGYGDIIGTLEGSPADPNTVVEPSVDRWSHTLTTLARLVPGPERYSYVFEGNAQVLDHILVNAAMLERITGFGFARINADFPEDERQSDHDAAFARFAPVARLSTTTSLPAALLSGTAFTFDVTVSNAGPDRAEDVVVRSTLPAGVTFASATTPEGWSCAAAGNTVTCTAGTLAPGASARLVVHAAAACNLSNGSTLSVTTAASSADDPESGDNGSSDSAMVSNPAPVIRGAVADKTVLWPANHKMHDIRVSYTTSDNCGTPDVSLSVTSSEPVGGDGDTAPDWHVLGANLVRLRAERAGNGPGRTYTIAITATDSAGNQSTQPVVVTVPHNQ